MCYTYDNLNRVTKRTIKNLSNFVTSEEPFTYDAAGNITDAPESCFQYDTNNRLVVNVVALVRNFIIYKKDLKIFSYKFWPYVLTITMGLMGLLSWQGYMSLIIIIAMMINTYLLCFPNTQTLRTAIIFTSVMVLIYNAYFGVWGGVLNEAIAITSAVIGIIRFRKMKVQRNEF